MIRRHWQLLAALACLAGAVVLALLAAELVRWERQMSRDDRLLQATPERSGLWQVSHKPSFDPSKWILGLDDDVAYRRALQLFWLGRPALVYKPMQPAWSVRAQVALARVADRETEPTRRAAALNLLGYLLLGGAAPQDARVRIAHLQQGISNFKEAVTIDPANDDAKLNLELALRAAHDFLDQFFGHGAGAGAATLSGAGLGLVGSGY